MDTYADDLATVIDTLDLKGATLVGFSTGGGEDLTEDLKKFDVPTLIVHGEDDQIVPFAAAAALSSRLVRNAHLKVYKGAPHGLTDTHKQQLNEDLLAFLKA